MNCPWLNKVSIIHSFSNCYNIIWSEDATCWVLIVDFVFSVSILEKNDRAKFCVNVKEFWLSLSTLEKALNIQFNVIDFWNEEQGLPFSNESRCYSHDSKRSLKRKLSIAKNSRHIYRLVQLSFDFFVFENGFPRSWCQILTHIFRCELLRGRSFVIISDLFKVNIE